MSGVHRIITVRHKDLLCMLLKANKSNTILTIISFTKNIHIRYLLAGMCIIKVIDLSVTNVTDESKY